MIPGSGRSPGEENGYALQYTCLENSVDRGAWQVTVHGFTKSRRRLSNFHSLTPLPDFRREEEFSILFFFFLRCCTAVSFMTSLRRTFKKVPDLILLKRTPHPLSAFAEHPPIPPSLDDIWISLCMVSGQRVIVKFFTSS